MIFITINYIALLILKLKTMKTMKIASYLFVSLFIVTLASCSSDDDAKTDDIPELGTLIGKWNASSITAEGSFTLNEIKTTFKAKANDLKDNNINFHADHTITGEEKPFTMELRLNMGGCRHKVCSPPTQCC